MGEGLRGVSEQSVIPADVVKRLGLPLAVADGTAQSEYPLSVEESFLGATLLLQHRAEGHVAVGLADLVAELLEQAQSLPDMGVGLVVAGKPGGRHARGCGGHGPAQADP